MPRLQSARASIVHDPVHLRERVQFIHEQAQSDAIAEQYIEGRELCIGVLGNDRLKTFPVWELDFRTGVALELPADLACADYDGLVSRNGGCSRARSTSRRRTSACRCRARSCAPCAR